MNITNPQFKYTPSVKTNIMDRFKDMGWTPPSKLKNPAPDAEDMGDFEYAYYVMKHCRDVILNRMGNTDEVEMLDVAMSRLKEVAL